MSSLQNLHPEEVSLIGMTFYGRNWRRVFVLIHKRVKSNNLVFVVRGKVFHSVTKYRVIQGNKLLMLGE